MMNKILQGAAIVGALVWVVGLVWLSGYERGKTTAEAAHQQLVTEATRKVEEANRRAAQALTGSLTIIADSDTVITQIENELRHENSVPDSCAISTDRLFALDKIR